MDNSPDTYQSRLGALAGKAKINSVYYRIKNKSEQISGHSYVNPDAQVEILNIVDDLFTFGRIGDQSVKPADIMILCAYRGKLFVDDHF